MTWYGNDKGKKFGADKELTKYAPYVTIKAELWDAYCEYFGENLPIYVLNFPEGT